MCDKRCVKTYFLVVVARGLQLIEQSHCSLWKKLQNITTILKFLNYLFELLLI